jgi:putative membrane protein
MPSLERVLLIAGATIWVLAALAPADRIAWALENMLLVVGAGWVIATYRKWRLSNASYLLIFIFFVLHVVGAHYTYSETPPGAWLESLFDTERNHYDRLVHFSFGLLLVSPFREQIERATRLSRRLAWGVGIMIIISLSTLYELAEWAVAELADPHNAIAFLGTQGDVFDSQKDTGLAVLGALIGVAAAIAARDLAGEARGRVARSLFSSIKPER